MSRSEAGLDRQIEEATIRVRFFRPSEGSAHLN
jgi:hypothetical protein